MRKLAFFAAFALVSVASSAHADDKTVKLPEYIVYGRNARPMAITDVSKLPAQTTLTELKQPLVQRVEQAVHSNPF